MASPVFTISIHNCRFYSYHGYFEEERKAGGEFIISVDVDVAQDHIGSITETVNYESLFDYVRNEMQKPRELLETLVGEMAAGIRQKFSNVRAIRIKISKINPPINNFSGEVSVSFVDK